MKATFAAARILKAEISKNNFLSVFEIHPSAGPTVGKLPAKGIQVLLKYPTIVTTRNPQIRVQTHGRQYSDLKIPLNIAPMVYLSPGSYTGIVEIFRPGPAQWQIRAVWTDLVCPGTPLLFSHFALTPGITWTQSPEYFI